MRIGRRGWIRLEMWPVNDDEGIGGVSRDERP